MVYSIPNSSLLPSLEQLHRRVVQPFQNLRGVHSGRATFGVCAGTAVCVCVRACVRGRVCAGGGGLRVCTHVLYWPKHDSGLCINSVQIHAIFVFRVSTFSDHSTTIASHRVAPRRISVSVVDGGALAKFHVDIFYIHIVHKKCSTPTTKRFKWALTSIPTALWKGCKMAAAITCVLRPPKKKKNTSNHDKPYCIDQCAC